MDPGKRVPVMTRLWLFLPMLLPLLAGCTRVQYVPVESVRTDSVFVYRNVTSALTIKDSVYIDKTRDTVRVVIYKYVGERYSKTDTVYINKTDSVAVPYPVERELGKWEQVKMDYGGKAIGLLAVAVAVAVYIRAKVIQNRK